MNIIIIYSSKYGVTKKYAYKIQKKLNCDISKDTDFDINDFCKYDTIIYGGRVTMGKIDGFRLIHDNFNNIKDKKIFLFFVGVYSEFNTINKVIQNNLNSEMRKVIDVSFFKGAYSYDNLTFFHKILMRLCIRMAKKQYKQYPSNDLKEEIKRMKSKIDLTNNIYIDDFIKKIINV